jgi:transposase-like protein
MRDEYPHTVMEFEKRFADEAACRTYLAGLRWPDGFVCPACGAVHEMASAVRIGHRWRCRKCRRQVSVTAGTVFQDSHLPLTLWLHAMWHVVGQKNGISAIGLQRVLGLGSYETAWMLLHKLRTAMVRPGRDRLTGRVEVDETFWGAPEAGVSGRQTVKKELLVIAVEQRGRSMGRVRMRRIGHAGPKPLHGFIAASIEPGSTVVTDGWNHYQHLKGYIHEPHNQSAAAPGDPMVLPRVHKVASLVKRWLMGTHQGGVQADYLDAYLDEYTFRFNRRASSSRGLLFHRLAQQSVQIGPSPLKHITKNKPLRHG